MTSPEQKYRKLTDVEHVLLRPGMYVGSTKAREEDVYLLDKASSQLVLTRVTYNPAFLKLFDEIVSNSVDEHRRNPKLTEIRVKIDSAKVLVWDNGGIPVVKHAEHDEWVPEMIFSNMKAGSNFNDEEERLVAGTNGVGSTITNIFSLEFTVRTSDGRKKFEQTFRKNMTQRDPPKITGPYGKFTEISYTPDLGRFGMTEIDSTHLEMMRRRCMDLAACNPRLKISFNGTPYQYTSFQDYCRLYSPEILYEETARWKVALLPSKGAFAQVSFVNSTATSDGGTHVEHVLNPIVDDIRARVKKKHKLELRPGEIRNQFFVLLQADIVNPGFSSQTKEKLITEVREFGSRFTPSERLLQAVFKSEITLKILDWAQQKADADERRQLRELNKNLSKEKVLKLIDAKATSGRVRCTLALFEGDSASSAFRKYRDPVTQGAFPLRGKFINVLELPNAKVIQNQEVKDLLSATGLKMGEEPKDLRYGKILIYSDADPDGDAIAGLLVNFFGKYWPELFQQGRICRVRTPLVVVKKGASEKHVFYSAADFEAWSSNTKNLNSWDISYKKGLAALEDDDYKDIIERPNMYTFQAGPELKSVLAAWFGGDVQVRKQKIRGLAVETLELDVPEEEVASVAT